MEMVEGRSGGMSMVYLLIRSSGPRKHTVRCSKYFALSTSNLPYAITTDTAGIVSLPISQQRLFRCSAIVLIQRLAFLISPTLF